MNVILMSSRAKAGREVSRFASRVEADSGTVIDTGFLKEYYSFLLRNFGYIPRRVYSSLGGVKLNGILNTNLLLWSEEFQQASWVKSSGATVTENTHIAPDETTTADTLNDTNAGSTVLVSQTISVLNNSDDRTLSLFVKKAVSATSYTALSVVYSGGTGVTQGVVVDHVNGVLVDRTGLAPKAKSIRSYGDYWRVSITVANNSTGNTSCAYHINPAFNSVLSGSNDGATLGSIIVWGAQLQTGTIATDYIKSEGVAGTATQNYVQTWYDLNNTSPVDAVQGTAVSQPYYDVDSDIGHRTLRFDGSNDFMSIADLGIFRNQGAGTLWSVAKDTNPTGGAQVHFIMYNSTNVSATRFALTSRDTFVVPNNVSRVSSRRLDADVSLSHSNSLSSPAGFNSFAGLANWGGNSLVVNFNKTAQIASTFTSGAGVTSDTNSATFNIGRFSDSSFIFVGVISEIHADRSVYTQSQINALHDFMKQYYPTLL